jgi:predicted acetyltransferase
MIRRAERDDIQALAALWTRAFPGERSLEQRIRQLETGGVFGGIEATWLAEMGGRMAGAFRAYSLTEHLHGCAYPMMGLGAVAVDETVRRRGIGRQLCIEAINIARDRGDVLSVLYPFRPAFYEALGWGHVGELHAFRFRPESLQRARADEVLRAGPDDTSAVAACYARVAAATNGLIARTPRIWRQHLEGDTTHAYLTGAPRVEGYLIARFSRGSVPDERSLYIDELVAETHEAYAALLGWIAAQRDAWRVILYDATPDEHFEHRLADPRPPGFRSARYLWAPVYRAIRGPMLRVLEVPAAVERRARWGPVAPLRFGLEVIDDVVPENTGPFVVDFDGRRANVTRGAARPALRTSARGFAQLFAGELQLTDAIRLDLAEVSGDASTIGALFRTDSCFRLLDEF